MVFDEMGVSIFGLYVHYYGIIIAFGMVLAVLLATYTFKKRKFSSSIVLDLALVAIPSAILGARIYFCVFYTNDYTFLQFFEIWNGGLAIYGGVIGGFIGVATYCLIKKISLVDICDCIAPSLILGQAIGRWGNFTNKEAYGNLITDPNLQFFPFGVLIPSNNFTADATDAVLNAFGSIPSEAWFMATFFYESMWNFLVFGIILFLLIKLNIRGLIVCSYFVLYGLGRVFIEGLRMDSLFIGETGIRVSQLLSAIFVAVFLAIAIYVLIKNKKDKKSNQASSESPVSKSA